MDLSGQNQNKMLVGAKNVQYLEQEWCMFNTNAKDLSKLGESITYACTNGDCTALGYGSSCNNLDANGNASYAFNMYFQMQNQDLQACNFGGLAKLSMTNISTDTCNFPIQIKSSAPSSLMVPSLWLLVALPMVLFM
ncbi:hypothetical protein PIB30_065661 [Stylosanthes scabra]|uniref:X8 domain-containing protein n=1 Tax=Stylosanthes scabra TaxID=79078 RepID=A0ABU6YP40_9FABA|nr:hypothetical protein [Stylosanthes scabra]